ncbi:hypothetical protein X743_26175 [Mesorhizobium sp. LNHC252B00]|nr:hypothetical protein X743_26175 [Mesorhizobium sp. LNHC252B00]
MTCSFNGAIISCKLAIYTHHDGQSTRHLVKHDTGVRS